MCFPPKAKAYRGAQACWKSLLPSPLSIEMEEYMAEEEEEEEEKEEAGFSCSIGERKHTRIACSTTTESRDATEFVRRCFSRTQ